MAGLSCTCFSFTLVVAITSLLAGFLGALTGLCGGTVLVPILTLMFGIDIRYAIGASLIPVIATSCGAAADGKEGFTNIRVGMFLEVATTLGALIGATQMYRASLNGLSVSPVTIADSIAVLA